MLKYFCHIIFAIVFFACSFASAAPSVQTNKNAFEFEEVDLGQLQQGVKKPVEIKGKNISSQTIEVESVFDQMVGGENFVYPKKIVSKQEFKINFTLNTAYIEGNFLHNIILVDTNGTPYIATVKGYVENPVVFSERLLDLGFYKKGNKKSWVFYVWNPNNIALKFKLKPESQKEFKAEFKDVKLDVRDFENIKEGGSTPGVKVTLSIINLELPKNNQRSIRKIVSFICENYPNATPELLVTGYWE